MSGIIFPLLQKTDITENGVKKENKKNDNLPKKIVVLWCECSYLNRKRVSVNPLRTLDVVGVTRFELATSWSRTKRSTNLSHTPDAMLRALQPVL